METKIIQIQVTNECIIALCEDGTLWKYFVHMASWEQIELPKLPRRGQG